ncbi:GNAT family N-acetyltransferase [Geomonas oryzae]|uniref:GNAT family N-acetyltransferase n=1 Tax=Geomonas oryzae TaxID=2364273 RepID=UPI00100B76D2|nr:GNAT family N-acetyltransferase [Geomonas oryzae]
MNNLLVPLRPEHVPDVVQTHLASFPGFFLSFLGARFLAVYYNGICSTPEGIGFCYLNASGVPAGFVVGSSNPRGFYSRLLRRHWLSFSLASVRAVLRKPSVLGRVARGFLHPGGNPVGNHVAGLYSIGVLPELQGTGAGKKLVNAFLFEAANRGCNRVFLTTDRDGNEAVNIFYQKLGFTLERQYQTREGRSMNEYWISVAKDGENE